jgi:Flp pilus assembly pilin Flp
MIEKLNQSATRAWLWFADRRDVLGSEAGMATWVEVALIVAIVLGIAIFVDKVLVPDITGGFSKAGTNISNLS